MSLTNVDIAELEVRVLAQEDSCKGYHSFPFPTHSGYSIFEVYQRGPVWYWSEFDDFAGAHTGFESQPFSTSQEAYRDALKENGVSAFR